MKHFRLNFPVCLLYISVLTGRNSTLCAARVHATRTSRAHETPRRLHAGEEMWQRCKLLSRRCQIELHRDMESRLPLHACFNTDVLRCVNTAITSILSAHF